MCRKLVLAATALSLIAVPAFAQERKAPAPAAKTQPAPAPSAKVKASPEQRALADRADPLTRAAFWNAQVAIDAADAEAGVKLAAALRGIERNAEAAEAAQRVILFEPRNLDAYLEVGRARIAEGQAFYGIDALRHAQMLAPRDWRPISLLGVAYEQVGRSADAAQAYEEALRLSPGNPSVLSNLALLHAARGDAPGAERLLRQAIARPGATVQMRQNLAYVLAVQGKMADAERLVREDLPPELANNNLAYLKALSDKPAAPARTWDALRKGG